MDGIRGSRPLGPGGAFGDAGDVNLGGVGGFGSWDEPFAPVMPVDAPSGWFDRADGLDPAPDDGTTAAWAFGGPSIGTADTPADGVEFGPHPLEAGAIPDLGLDFAFEPGLEIARIAPPQPLETDGVDFTAEFGPLPQLHLQDGVDEVLEPLPLFLDGTDGVDFDLGLGLAPVAGTVDGADPWPDDVLPPPATPELDALWWDELELAGVSDPGDAVFVRDIEPLAIHEPTF